MNNQNFCVVVKDANGVPHFVSANCNKEEANKLLHLLNEGEIVSAEEGRKLKRAS